MKWNPILNFLQALAKFQTTQKVTTKSGIEQENELLNESAAKETSLNLHIMDLENETKQVSNGDQVILHKTPFQFEFLLI